MEQETIETVRAFFRFAAHLGHGCGLVDGGGYESPLLKLARAMRKENPNTIDALDYTHIFDRGKGA